ncbi:TRAP transporter substrate-binding protein DctP [Martelella sp. FLE1502]
MIGKLKTAAIASAIFMMSGQVMAEEVTIKLSYNNPDTTLAWQSVYEPYARDLETLSDGRIKVDRYPNGVLHHVTEGFKALASGIVDVAPAYPVYMASSFQLIHAMDLPYVLPDSNIAAGRVVNEEYADYMRPEYEKMGIYLAFAGTTATYDILADVPINTLEDLKGLKIRAAGTTATEIVTRLGAVPVNISVADAYSALQSGVVDGAFLAPGDMEAYNLHEQAQHLYRTRAARVFVAIGMRKDMYDGLPEDLQNVFKEAGNNAMINMAEMYEQLTSEGLEKMAAEGVTIVEPSAEDRAEIRRRLDPMIGEFREKNKDLQDPSVDEVLSSLAALSAEYGDLSDEEVLTIWKNDPIENFLP